MGAAASLPYVQTKPFYRQIFSNVSGTKHTIDICLACERDGYPNETRNISVLKENLRNFLKGVFKTDKYTVFRWSTWDEIDADIVIPTEDLIVARRRNVADRYKMPPRFLFDAIFTIHCPFAVISDTSFRTSCALLKPLGILVNVTEGPNQEETFSLRPNHFGDCSEDEVDGRRFRLHQVHRSVVGGKHVVVWQKTFE